MIASHDSYTYQKPKNILLNLISNFWKCQKKDINEQYNLGVRVFDVRVYRYNNVWGTAHGMIHFNQSFNTLSDICKYFKDNFEGSIIRIYLEDNVNDNEEIKNLFLHTRISKTRAPNSYCSLIFFFWHLQKIENKFNNMFFGV